MTSVRRVSSFLSVVFVFMLLFVNTASSNIDSGPYVPGETYDNNMFEGGVPYIEYEAGNLPVVISVPHGGYLEPDGSIISDREETVCDDADFVGDSVDFMTQELAREIRDALYKKTGGTPHIIYNNLARIKLDANRDVAQAACGDSVAAAAWSDFHAFIDEAIEVAVKDTRFGKVFYMDLHGFTPADGLYRDQIGYTLPGPYYYYSDTYIDSHNSMFRDDSSLRCIAEVAADNGVPFSEILRGQSSFGGLLDLDGDGYGVLPSPRIPNYTGSVEFYVGQYNIETHATNDPGDDCACGFDADGDGNIDEVYPDSFVSGFQIEVINTRRENENLRKDYAAAVADAMIAFISNADYYNIDLDSVYLLPPGVLSASDGTDDNNILVEWNQVVNVDAEGYKIYRSDSINGTYSGIAVVNNGSTTAYTDTGHVPGDVYYYKVASIRNSGSTESQLSDPVQGSTTSLVPVYTYDINDSVYDMFECDVDEFPFSAYYHLNDQESPTTEQYNGISADDTSRWSTDDPGDYDEIWMLSQVNVTADMDAGDIDKIQMYFKGYTDYRNSGVFQIWVLNHQAGYWYQESAWEMVGEGQWLTKYVDGVMTRTLEGVDFTDYINNDGKLVWMVGTPDGHSASLHVNYMKTVVIGK